MDAALRLEMPQGVTLVGFADDVAVIVVAKTEQGVTRKGNYALRRIKKWLNDNGLELAPEKTEAVLLSGRRKIEPIAFQLGNTVVTPGESVKYLGVIVNSRLAFTQHIEKCAGKAMKTVAAVERVMPNVGGPSSSKRKLLSTVAHSVMLYAPRSGERP